MNMVSWLKGGMPQVIGNSGCRRHQFLITSTFGAERRSAHGTSLFNPPRHMFSEFTVIICYLTCYANVVLFSCITKYLPSTILISPSDRARALTPTLSPFSAHFEFC